MEIEKTSLSVPVMLKAIDWDDTVVSYVESISISKYFSFMSGENVRVTGLMVMLVLVPEVNERLTVASVAGALLT